MKRLLTRVLLLLGFLLPCGYGQLHAYGYHGEAIYCQITSETSLHANGAAEQNNLLLFTNPDGPGKRTAFRIDVTEVKEQEEDEHESSSFKKNHKKADSYFNILYAHALLYSYAGGKRSSFFYQHCSYFSLYRYILLRVFKI